jgi:hypothetical protein
MKSKTLFFCPSQEGTLRHKFNNINSMTSVNVEERAASYVKIGKWPSRRGKGANARLA